MCYSVEASLTAWVISYAIAIYLFYRNQNYDRWNAAFIISFSTIQLIEAGLWLTNPKNPNNSDINGMLTKILLIVLLCQPLVQSFMGYKNTESDILFYMSIVFLLILVYGFLKITSNASLEGHGVTFNSSVGENGHLVWERNDTKESQNELFLGPNWIVWLYLLGLFLPLLFMKEYRGLPLLAVGLGTFYYNTKYSNTKEFGSMWCYSAVIYSIVALFV